MADSKDGSTARIITTATTTNIATTGLYVVDHVVIADDTLATDLSVSIRNAAGVEIHGWDNCDGTNIQYKVHGLRCGPLGIRVSPGPGLQIVTAGTLGFEITVLYRLVDSFAGA